MIYGIELAFACWQSANGAGPRFPQSEGKGEAAATSGNQKGRTGTTFPFPSSNLGKSP